MTMPDALSKIETMMDAYPAPWKFDTYGTGAMVFDAKGHPVTEVVESDGYNDVETENRCRRIARAKAKAIVAAVNLLPALIREVRAARAIEDYWREHENDPPRKIEDAMSEVDPLHAALRQARAATDAAVNDAG